VFHQSAAKNPQNDPAKNAARRPEKPNASNKPGTKSASAQRKTSQNSPKEPTSQLHECSMSSRETTKFSSRQSSF